jgi:hypothetical protein
LSTVAARKWRNRDAPPSLGTPPAPRACAMVILHTSGRRRSTRSLNRGTMEAPLSMFCAGF